MPNVTAPTLKPITVMDKTFFPGDTFVQPKGYPDLYVVDLFADGTIGGFDINLLAPEYQVIMSDPSQLSRRRCPSCG